jgi:hypothetical protein
MHKTSYLFLHEKPASKSFLGSTSLPYSQPSCLPLTAKNWLDQGPDGVTEQLVSVELGSRLESYKHSVAKPRVLLVRSSMETIVPDFPIRLPLSTKFAKLACSKFLLKPSGRSADRTQRDPCPIR